MQQLADSGMWPDTGSDAADGSGEEFRPEEAPFQSFSKSADRHVNQTRHNAGSQRVIFPIAPSTASSSAWIRPVLGLGTGCPFPAANHTLPAPASISTANYTYVCQNNIIVRNSEDGHNFYTNERN